ncbi:MAG TPA: hypothetical protein VKB34_02635 [Povalibacter sp.]|nr:hypothetical protein [Povalibacter sp.]
MMRIVLLAVAFLCGGCTTVKINKDDTTSITHEGGIEAGRELAARACSKAGGQQAEIVSTVNKDPSMPPGTGKQVTTFRCRAR